MDDAFTVGIGFADGFHDRCDNYGAQLDFTIKKVLIKGLKAVKPLFKHKKDTKEGMLEREKWITEKKC